MFPSPLLYTSTEENKTSLINDLKENKPKVIVVNDKVAVWSEVETILKENYQQVKTDYSEFKVYKIKYEINILCIFKNFRIFNTRY